MVENWLPVVGYEEHYEVSDQGQVWTLARVMTRSNGRPHRVAGKMRSQGTTPKGYRKVTLVRDGALRSFTVHGLVLAAFVGPRPDGMMCRHFDGNPANNHLSNLRWGTASENQQDSLRHGTHALAAMVDCKRGHHLAGKNLVPTKNTSRACRACAREHQSAQFDGREFDPARADARYADVLAGRRRHKSEQRF